MRAPRRSANLLFLLSPGIAWDWGSRPSAEVRDTYPAGASAGAEVGVGTAAGGSGTAMSQKETARGAGMSI